MSWKSSREGNKMNWNLEEAMAWYGKQGAPRDQMALVNLLREIQGENGGSIPRWMLSPVAEGYGVKESLLLALIRRYPSLRLADTHLLEICAGPNCGKHAALAAAAEELRKKGITVKFVPCMRLCGKGPNLKWDGTLHHKATPELLKKLTEK